MPRVTVCIPSYNLGKYIEETIQSVLNQTFQDFELLIEDDGSTDDSVARIRKFDDKRINLVAKEQNEGQNRTTNNLVRRAAGEYISLLPADDVWMPDKLALQVEYLDTHSTCGITFGWPRFMDDTGDKIDYPDADIETLKNAPRKQWQDRLKNGNCVFIATSLYRRSLHDELGYFSEDLHILADLEWYIRIAKEHDIHVVQNPIARIRQRDNMANLSAPTFDNLVRNSDELDIVNERHYPVDRSKRKLLIATPFYEVKGYAPYIRSLVQTVYWLSRHTDVNFEWTERSGDSYVWRARNAIADFFLKSDSTELIFIDSDQGWSLESFVRLIQADVDIVGGAYPVKNNWEQYGVTIHTTGPNNAPDVDVNTGLIWGEKVPTGFMKIKRKVFESLKIAQPDNWYWESNRKMFNFFGHSTIDHVAYGEDISFCKRCESIGLKIWVEPRCTIEHIGVQSWHGNYHNYLQRQPGGSQEKKAA